MKLLDLYCGAGGAAMVYHMAGFDDITGVDIRPMPRYPFRFVQGDALEYLYDHGHEFDAIHASPPCQGFSRTKTLPWTRGFRGEIPNMIPTTRAALQAFDVPWVIENVPGAPLVCPITLCGIMFDLKVFRHRLFESNILLMQPPHELHGDRVVGKGGFVCCVGHGDAGRGRIPADHRSKASWQAAMRIDWMTMAEMAESIPPAYTEFIGRQLLAQITRQAA